LAQVDPTAKAGLLARLRRRSAATALPQWPATFSAFLQKYSPHPVSPAWMVCAKALEGEFLTFDELEVFGQLAQHRQPPPDGAELLLVVAGRGSAKTEFLAVYQLYVALTADRHFRALPPGSQLSGALVAGVLKQSRVAFKYIADTVARHPEMRAELDGAPTMAHGVGVIRFKSGYEIVTHAWSKAGVRGGRYACVTVDESAWTPNADVSVDQDVEVVAALQGGLVAPDGAPARRFIAATSAGAKRGWVWDVYSQLGAKPHAHVLVCRGPTTFFNPSVSLKQLARIRERDPARYRREYEFEFSDSVSAWISAEHVDACARSSAAPLPPRSGVTYVAGCDFAFQRAAAVLTMAHEETGDDGAPKFVVDAVVRMVPMPGEPLDAPELVRRFADVMREYGCYRAVADQFAIVPLQGEFKRHGIELVEETATSRSKYDHFTRLKEALIARRVSLPRHDVLLRELRDLQEISTGGGNVRIDHASGGSSDAACATAWALAALALGGSRRRPWWADVEDADPEAQQRLVQGFAALSLIGARRWGGPWET
jgi:hypothetical protein